MQWDAEAKEKYEKILSKIPLFHRELTKKVVDEKAPMIASERNSKLVEEDDIVKAFVTEVPRSFYSLMIRLMDDVGFNHEGY